MIEQKNIGGKLNTDASPYKVPPMDYIDALNITRNSQSELKDDIVSNIVGNSLVPYTQPVNGIPKTIGAKYDPVRNRVYYFVWNSAGYHFIVYWDRSANIIFKVIENITDTNGVDILKFNPSYRINHVDIINIDDTGDLMFWTDTLNPPRKLNVLTATSGGYTPFFLDSFLDVIKAPPTAPPRVVYINDNTVTVNNLQKKLFVFKYRFIYDDLEKSVPSSQSLMPLPLLSTNPSVDQDPTKNCGIFMIFQTGLSNVKKIELWGAQSLGNEFGEFFIIDVLHKTDLGIPNDDLFSYTFYNNQAYAFADPTEASQIFDYVPLATNGQALLNGNILAYAGTTENYDLLPSTDGIDVTTVSTSNPEQYQDSEIVVANNVRTAANGFLYTRIFIAGILFPGDDIIIINNGGFTINEVVGGSDTISTLLARLANDYVVDASYTLVQTTSNSILVSKPNAQVLNTSITNTPNNAIGNNSVGCYDWNSHYQFYVVYFDENGRTNSAQGSLLGSTITPNYNESAGLPVLPIINLSINYRPPVWAKYFQIVRTNNLTKSYSEYWISDRTYQDTTINNAGYQYAYISIANLNQFVLDNPTTGSQLTYGFTPNDRIRFVKRYAADGTTANIYTGNDFQIQASLLNPVINGAQQQGQFLQIILPTNLSTDFNFGSSTFANYLINIYTPALSASNNLNLYYEFGKECYPIGNWGTVTAFHYGYKQNQLADLSIPATFALSNNGDAYYRNRNIPVGNELNYDFVNTPTINANTGSSVSVPLFFDQQSYNNVNYTPQSYLTINTISKDTNILRVQTGAPYTVTFKVTGSITIKINSLNNNTPIIYIQASLVDTAGTGFGSIVPLVTASGVLEVSETYTYQINTQITASQPNSTNLVIDTMTQVGGVDYQVVSGTLKLQEILPIGNQGVVDYNFSDFYPSKVNSNGRAFIYDSNAKQVYNPVLIRNGETFEFGTNINGINRFYGTNFDQYDRNLGAIVKMYVEGRILWVFQEFDTGNVPILQQMVQDTTDNPLGAESTNILNKIQYPFKGKFGIGFFPESFAYYDYAVYFIDPNKCAVIRISQDGLINISNEKEMEAYFVSQLKAYQPNLNNGIGAAGQPYMGSPTGYGVFDYATKKYIIGLEAINRYDNSGNLLFSQPSATLTFNEVRDEMEGFESFVSFAPEYMVSIGTLLCSFKNGALWTHDNTTLMSNFYGVQYPASITLVFNKDVELKKKFLAVSYQGNTVWASPTNGNITTSMVNPQTGLFQQSQLISVDYEVNEGLYYAALWRDANSGANPVIALLEGDFLNGNWIAIKFTYTGNNSAYILMPYVSSIPSGRNG